jgi:hypothetical protein
MNSVWEPRFISDVDCDSNSNQTEVVLLIPLRSWVKEYPKDKLERSLLPFIRHKNYKIILFERSFEKYAKTIRSAKLLLIKKQLQANQKVKIIFFQHFKNIENCNVLMMMLSQLQLIQLPYTTENLGLILFENGEHEKWDKGYEKYDLDLFPNRESVYVAHGMAWDHCVDLSYRYLKCEKFECPALKILINKDTANQYTNLLLVKMTEDGQLKMGKEKLEALINERLKFTSLSAHDVKIFQPETFKKLQNLQEHQQEILLKSFEGIKEASMSLISESNGTSAFSIFNPKLDPAKILFEHHYSTVIKRKPKRQTSQKIVDDILFINMLFLIKPLITRSDPFSLKIQTAVLELSHRLDSEHDEKSKKIICGLAPVVLKFKTIATKLVRDDALAQNLEVLQGGNSDMIQTVASTMSLKMYLTALDQVRGVTRAKCDEILQYLFKNFTNNCCTPEGIGPSVDRLLNKLTQWADKVPIYDNEPITWDNFSNWIGTDAILLAGINDYEIRENFVLSQQFFDSEFLKRNQDSIALLDPETFNKTVNGFHWMVRELLLIFNRNVTSVAIQRLAISKLQGVDDVVAALDQSFMQGIKNLHQSIDCDQWFTIRPHIFYYLVRLQHEAKTFDHFMMVVRRMFDIHDIERPMATFEKLQDIKAEFDVYQKRMGGYINGSINTTQQWGRHFYETTEYIFKNSGTAQKSFINGAVKWIKDELVYERKTTWPGFYFDGTLVLVNLIIRRFFNGRRNLW